MTTRVLGILASSALATGALAQGAVTLQVATHYSDEQVAPLIECFRAFEAESPGVTVEHQVASYGDFLQTILTSRVGGAAPDIYNIYSIWAPQLAAAGVLEPLPPEIVEMVNAGYSPATVAAATIDGELRGIPTELSIYALIYNKELLAAAGYDAPPATWAELREVAAAITTTNDQGNIDVGGYAYGTSVAEAVHVFYAQMYAAGVAPFSEDGRSTNLTTPEAVRILEDQVALFADGITSNAIAVENFSAGAVGMQIGANWNRAEFAAAFGEDRLNEVVGVAPIPTDGPGGSMLYTFLWAVDAASDAKPEAWDLLAFLSAPRDGAPSCTGAAMAGMGALTGNAADLAAMGDMATEPFTAGFVAVADRAQTQPNVWQAAEVDRILRGYIELAWNGDLTAADALAAADAEIVAILGERP